MNNEPNIFDFATGELSQDAFICWLLSWLEFDGEHELKHAAKKFVVLLCKKNELDITYTEDKQISIDKIGKLLSTTGYKNKVLQQYGKMDVFFAIDIDGTRTEFIIEDKTNTFPHSNQLQKYVDFVIKNQKADSHPIVKIYYKSGYLYKKDRDACSFINRDDFTDEQRKRYQFAILDYKDIDSFIDNIETDNLVFNSYKSYISRNKQNYIDGLKSLSTSNGYENIKFDYFQYELMNEISAICPQTIGNKTINHGSSMGLPWTQYRFIFLQNFYAKDINESVFYRFERRKNKSKNESKNEYCLSLRHYVVVKNINKIDKLERLNIYKALFSQASKDVGDLSFGKAITDKSGSNSSEIAVLFFEPKKNNLINLKAALPVIHQSFIKLLHEKVGFLP